MTRAVGKDIDAFQDGTVRQMEGGNRVETDVALSELAQVQQFEALSSISAASALPKGIARVLCKIFIAFLLSFA
ncbi:MAG: hypothetical protein WBM59_16145 [Sedimenticolaceae bacterium]